LSAPCAGTRERLVAQLPSRQRFSLTPNALVVLADVRRFEGEDDTLLQLLDGEELSRYHRFKFVDDRQLFLVAHALLRSLLGHLTGRDPASLSFEAGPFGKPRLSALEEGPAVHFNLSHSFPRLLLAFDRTQQLGVDLEGMKPLADRDALARCHFHAAELAQLEAAAPTKRVELFYRFWTCKEAVLKAAGTGLSSPLRELDTSGCDGREAAVIRTTDGRSFWVKSLPVGQRFHAAIAAPASLPNVDIHRAV
jgi:4'-phosphopantetheinyl transferase